MVSDRFEGSTLTVSGWGRRDQSEFAVFLETLSFFLTVGA